MRWGQRILSKVISVWQKWFPTCCHHSQWWMKAKRLNSGCFIFSNQKPFRHNFRSFWTKVSIMKFLLSGGNFSTQICDNLQFTFSYPLGLSRAFYHFTFGNKMWKIAARIINRGQLKEGELFHNPPLDILKLGFDPDVKTFPLSNCFLEQLPRPKSCMIWLFPSALFCTEVIDLLGKELPEKLINLAMGGNYRHL